MAEELKEVMKLKGGENSHLKAWLMGSEASGKNIYSSEFDLGAKVRDKGWTNIGDISACLKTSVGLGEIYKKTKRPYIAVASKHTRPVVIANGKTQLEAVIKAIAGDLNSPFGGFWGFNQPLEYDTAQFLDKMFFEGVLAPEFEKGTAKMLQDTSKVGAHKNRFLIETGYIKPDQINILGYTKQPVSLGYDLKQTLEPPFDVKKEAVVVAGNIEKNTDINSLSPRLIDDIHFAGNAALYLASNLVFYVHDGAIAGLGDGCGARMFAAEKARNMLEKSAYAALSVNNNDLWDAVLYDTPFTRNDFESIDMPLVLTAFSDAFFPKLDGFVEASGIDRNDSRFGERKVSDGKGIFIPKRNNFNANYNTELMPYVVVQPGGSLGDKQVLPMAEKYGIIMAFTMTPELGQKYLAGEKVNGKTPTGRRFFGHMTM